MNNDITILELQPRKLGGSVKTYTENGKSYLDEAAKSSGNKNSYHLAIQEFILAYKHALSLNSNKDAERSCLFNLGAAYIAAEYFSRGLDVLLSIANVPVSEYGPSKGDVLFNIGLAYDKMKQQENAIKYYRDAISEFKLTTVSFTPTLCETLVNLGKIYVVKGETTQAGDLFTNAATRYFEQNQYEPGCHALLHKADAMISGKNLVVSECRSVLEDCVESTLKIPDQNTQSKLFNDIGLKLTLLSEYDKALQCYEASQRLCSPDDRAHSGHTLQNIGAVYNRVEDFQKAISYHRQSIAVHGEIGNRNAQGQCFCNLAFAQSQLGMYESAQESYSHALQAFKDTGDKSGEWQVYEGLAAVSLLFDRVSKSVLLYQRAIKAQALSKDLDTVDQDRLIRKLTYALSLQNQRQLAVDRPRSVVRSRSMSREGREANESRLPMIGPPMTEVDSALPKPKPPSRKRSSKSKSRDDMALASVKVETERLPQITSEVPKKKVWKLNRGRRGYEGDNDRPFMQVARGLSSFTDQTISSLSDVLEDPGFESDVDDSLMRDEHSDNDIYDHISDQIPEAVLYKGRIYSTNSALMGRVSNDIQNVSHIAQQWRKERSRRLRPSSRAGDAILFEEPNSGEDLKVRPLTATKSLRRNNVPLVRRPTDVVSHERQNGGLSVSSDDETSSLEGTNYSKRYREQLLDAEKEMNEDGKSISSESSSSSSDEERAAAVEEVDVGGRPNASMPTRTAPQPPQKPPRSKKTFESPAQQSAATDNELYSRSSKKSLRFSPRVEKMGDSTHLYETLPAFQQGPPSGKEKPHEEVAKSESSFSSNSEDEPHQPSPSGYPLQTSGGFNVEEEDGRKDQQDLYIPHPPDDKKKKSKKSKLCVIM